MTKSQNDYCFCVINHNFDKINYMYYDESVLKALFVRKDFPTLLPVGWQLCCQIANQPEAIV